MEDARFKLLTGLIVKGRKVVGSIDSHRLLHEPAYAETVFKAIEEHGDEDLVLLSIQLREALAAEPIAAPDASPAHGATPQDGNTKSYVYGARS